MANSIIEKLVNIQTELKAPKGNYNSFGNYSYRSCEDILEAVKPLLKAQGVALNLSDEIVAVGERVYVKATASLTDGDNEISVSAYAREAETKKGLDVSQITGTASSYARKYCLGGLLLCDDQKDADTDEYTRRTSRNAPANTEKGYDETEIISETDAHKIRALAVKAGKDVGAMCDYFGVKSPEEMTKRMYADAFKMLTGRAK